MRGGGSASRTAIRSSTVSGSPASELLRSSPSGPSSRASTIRASPLPYSRQAGRALLGVALVGEQLVVAGDRLLRRAVELDAAVAQQHRALAEALDRGGVVRDEDDRPAALLELEDLREALALELLVADGEDLVEQEHVGVDVRGDGEAEAHVHAATSRCAPAGR